MTGAPTNPDAIELAKELLKDGMYARTHTEFIDAEGVFNWTLDLYYIDPYGN